MKLAKILDENFYNALRRLSAQKISIKAAYTLKGINKRIEEELVRYEEVRKELIIKYGKKDEQNNLIVSEDNLVELEDKISFAQDMSDLINIDVDVGSIAIDSLGENVSISADDLEALEGLVY